VDAVHGGNISKKRRAGAIALQSAGSVATFRGFDLPEEERKENMNDMESMLMKYNSPYLTLPKPKDPPKLELKVVQSRSPQRLFKTG
jgi:hypothetical protein